MLLQYTNEDVITLVTNADVDAFVNDADVVTLVTNADVDALVSNVESLMLLRL